MEKMVKKDDQNDGALWFKQAKVAATTVAVAQLCLIPAVFAYDALMDAIPVHVMWERIKMANMQNNEGLRSYILNFLQAAHTDHNASNTALVDIGTHPVLSRQHKDAKQWAKEKVARLFGTVRVAGTVAASLPAAPAGRNTTSTSSTGFPENCRGIDCNPSCRKPCKSSRKRGNRSGHGCNLVQNIWFVHNGYGMDA